MHDDEIWYEIPGFDGAYEFSSDQRVRSFRDGRGGINPTKWRFLKQHTNKDGYPYFKLRCDGKRRTVTAHKIVAALIYGPTPEGEEIRHWDDQKTNNYPSNLSFGTSADNKTDARRNGTLAIGERHGRAKLTEADVLGIRRLAGSGLTWTTIGERFGITGQQAGRIVRRKRWPHVPEEAVAA